MRRNVLRKSAVILIDLILLAIGIAHLPAVHDRPFVPFEVLSQPNGIVVSRITDSSSAAELRAGDQIAAFAGVPVQTPESLELLGDLHAIGDSIVVERIRSANVESTVIRLVPYYPSLRFTVIMALVGFAIWGMGVIVAVQRLDSSASRVLHIALVSLGMALLLTQGRVDPTDSFGVVNRLLLLVTYMLAATGFYCFSQLYPAPATGWLRTRIVLAVLLMAAMIGAAAAAYLRFLDTRSPVDIALFHAVYDGYHGAQALFAAGMIVTIIRSYRRAKNTDDRVRLQWILWGLAAGPAPYLFSILVPNIILSRDLIPEEIATAFLLVTPFSLSVSLLRHQLFDIEILINRSVVYALLTLFVAALYGLGVFIVVSVLGEELLVHEYAIAAAVTVAAALAFNPLRRRLQHVVDATLFPVRYDFRRAIHRATESIHRSLSIDELCGILARELSAMLPLAGVGIFIREGEQFRCCHAFASGGIVAGMTLPVSPSGMLPLIEGAGIVVPLRRDDGAAVGLCAAMPRRPEERFSPEEREYMDVVCAESARTIERLQLQRTLMVEADERRRSEEISRMKSFFVSSVSHELRTPLTSIRMFAEMLRDGRIPAIRKQKEYLGIIDHEAERLTRMIDNVLDFSRIERGVKEYRREPCDLRTIVEQAAAAMAYPFSAARAQLRSSTGTRALRINADADAVQAAVINLLSNGLKYSTRTKRVSVMCGRTGNRVFVRVKDRGIGIPADQIPHIFEQFFRVRDGRAAQVGGMGLGLSLVKHIVDAHDGTIDVQSRIGAGSTFEISFPVHHEPREDA